MENGKTTRRWFQFSLRTLLVMVLVAGAGLGLLGRQAQRIWRRERAVAQLHRIGARVGFQQPGWPARLLGFEVGPLVAVDLRGTHVTDDGLKHLRGITGPGRLWLGGTQITDAGLEHLAGLDSLYRLDLERTKITDAGLRYLRGLKSLEDLSLRGTQVSDAGLGHLEEVASLKFLDLAGTRVTPEGVKRLRQTHPEWEIVY
jgi:hypothetical protein